VKLNLLVDRSSKEKARELACLRKTSVSRMFEELILAESVKGGFGFSDQKNPEKKRPV
jgi:hypothetical protein